MRVGLKLARLEVELSIVKLTLNPLKIVRRFSRIAVKVVGVKLGKRVNAFRSSLVIILW